MLQCQMGVSRNNVAKICKTQGVTLFLISESLNNNILLKILTSYFKAFFFLSDHLTIFVKQLVGEMFLICKSIYIVKVYLIF